MRREIFAQKVFPLFSFSLVIMTIGAFAGMFIPPALYLPVSIAYFLVLILTYFVRSIPAINLIMFCALVFLSGTLTAPIIIAGLKVGGLNIIVNALGMTTIVMIGLAGYVYITRADFTWLGPIVSVSLILIIIISFISGFLGAGINEIVLSVAGLIIFMGFVLYDMSAILRRYDDDEYIMATISLYFDFLNIFINILRILIASHNDKD